MKTRVIDLLNKIANGELPNGTKIFAKKGSNYCWFNFYRHQEIFNSNQFSRIAQMGVGLNDEIEVTEEKEIEKITKRTNKVLKRELIYKLNELTEAVNELKKGK